MIEHEISTPSNNMTAPVVIGRFGAPHGIRGDIRVHSFTDPLLQIIKYQPWQVSLRGQPVPVEITRHQQHNDQLIVHIKGFDDRDEVRCFTNLDIAVPRESLPETNENEHYWHDLIGLAVVNINGEEMGVITAIFATGSNDVIVIEKDGKESYIPYLNTVVLNIDHNQRRMQVDWEPLE